MGNYYNGGPKIFLWLGWAQITKKVPHTQPRPLQPPSKPALATEKMGS
jgi:hypothetical protein